MHPHLKFPLFNIMSVNITLKLLKYQENFCQHTVINRMNCVAKKSWVHSQCLNFLTITLGRVLSDLQCPHLENGALTLFSQDGVKTNSLVIF